MAFEALMISLILNLVQHINSIAFTNRNRISIPGNSLSDVHRCDTGKMESFQCHLSSRFSNTLCAEGSNSRTYSKNFKRVRIFFSFSINQVIYLVQSLRVDTFLSRNHKTLRAGGDALQLFFHRKQLSVVHIIFFSHLYDPFALTFNESSIQRTTKHISRSLA